MRNEINRRLDSESFGGEGRHFFVDLMRASDNQRYLRLTRAVYKAEKFYERSSVIVFEEDFEFLVEAISMVLTRYTHGEGRTA